VKTNVVSGYTRKYAEVCYRPWPQDMPAHLHHVVSSEDRLHSDVGPGARAVRPGLGRIVALCCRSSTSYQIH
jgi:hypothetical protein